MAGTSRVCPPGQGSVHGEKRHQFQLRASGGMAIPAACFPVHRLDLFSQRLSQSLLQRLREISFQVLQGNAPQIDLQLLNAMKAVGRTQVRAACINNGLQVLALDTAELAVDLARGIFSGHTYFHYLPTNAMLLSRHVAELLLDSRRYGVCSTGPWQLKKQFA